MKKLLILVCIGLTLNGCSKSSKNEQTQTFKFDDKSTATKVFNNSKIYCDGTCPSFSGGMTVFTEKSKSYEVSVCSLTYIGGNKVLANKHCLPDDMSASLGRSCAKRIKIKFPKTANYPEESFDCNKVDAYSKFSVHSEDYHAVPDWLVLTFSGSTQRTAVEINRTSGLSHGLQTIAYPVFYNLDEDQNGDVTVDGRMKKIECKMNRSLSIANTFFDDFSAMFYGNDCTHKVIKGNSGSGLLNTSSQLVGLISFVSLKEEYDIKKTVFGGTNISCIPVFGANPPTCDFEDSQSFFSGIAELSFISRLNLFPHLLKKIEGNPSIHPKNNGKYKIADLNQAQITSTQNQSQTQTSHSYNEHIAQLIQLQTSDIIMYDKVDCLNRDKVNQNKYIDLPIKNFLPEEFIYTKNDVTVAYSVAPARFLLEDMGSSFNATLVESENTEIKKLSEHYIDYEKSCSKHKKSESEQILTLANCYDLIKYRKKMEAMGSDTAAQVYAQNLLTDKEAKKIVFSIPACQ